MNDALDLALEEGIAAIGGFIALKSAENYRALRKKGIRIRRTTDVIIATFCIENNVPILFSDKDFKPFVQHLGLQSAFC